MDIKKLVRSEVLNLIPYESARKIGGMGDVWLNANESPYYLTFNLSNKKFNRYPEPQSKTILLNYSKYLGHNINSKILITRGADEAIDLLIRTFCIPNKDMIIYFPPTYGMYHISALISGIKNKIINIYKNNNFYVDNFFKQFKNVKLIFICRPNNPTGDIISQESIIYILQNLNNTLLIIDEAYIEFILNESFVLYVKKYINLIILRTMSKAFALAGLRCGFIIADKLIIQFLSKIIAPYPLSTPVIDIVSQSLIKKNVVLMYTRVIEINSNRIWFIYMLRSINYVIKIFDSVANYLLVYFEFSEKIFRYLWDNGIIVRNQKSNYLKNCIRITVGSKLECLKIIMKLKEYNFIK
ncbi:histidinol-phosphate transaminase [Buchnera aphidicola (Mollitrichosiphum nigrofasciatum)]|uniref:histidinol-phosphate transaminase n=1 Tax=Buchnera aphidicola TaxID=9 RepID=UPI0031B8A519